MSFKFFFFILFFFIFLSCGVKNDPIPPGGVYMPSVENKYLDLEDEKKREKEEKKSDKTTEDVEL